ncbi:MAG: hypothetical protein II774_08770, partial [Lachnospiraceae bacterium]|nr:hypothetical protein [Lachnospiraceae bacterium]
IHPFFEINQSVCGRYLIIPAGGSAVKGSRLFQSLQISVPYSVPGLPAIFRKRNKLPSINYIIT